MSDMGCLLELLHSMGHLKGTVSICETRDIGTVRHERRRRSHVGDPFRSGAVREIEDCWPSSVGPRGRALNHPELRWLKTVVVSVREKAWRDRVRWGSGRRARAPSLAAVSLLKRRKY